MSIDYVHGYSAKERTRLADQASTLTGLLHADTRYRPGSLVLEAGCGVGAQTVILAANSPAAAFTSVDISAESLAVAQRQVRDASLPNVTFQRADIFALPFGAGHFDHVFVCFVLEHLADPAVPWPPCSECSSRAARSPSSRAITARLTSTRTAATPGGPSSA